MPGDRLLTGFGFNPKFIGFLNSDGLYTDHQNERLYRIETCHGNTTINVL